MVTILREADEKPVPELAKKHGVSAQTIYAWQKHFGSLGPSEVKRLRRQRAGIRRDCHPALVANRADWHRVTRHLNS
jgi:transposase-like protein